MKSYLNLQTFMNNPMKFLDARMGGHLVQEMKLGPKRFILVFDADEATRILVQKADIYPQSRMVFNRIKPVTGKRGLVQLQGKESRKARKVSREIFTPTHLEKLKLIIESYIEETLDGIKPGTALDIMTLMTDFTIRTAFRMFLGIDVKSSPFPFGEVFLKLNRLCGKQMLSPISFPSLKILRLQKMLRREIKKIVHAHRTELNVVELFKDDEDLIDHCMTFLFAGHETTAASLAFTLLILGEKPELQQGIQKNPSSILNIYKESLRLYSPAYMLAREAVTDDQIGDLRVKRGDQILIGLSQIHRSKNYFQEPLEFNHERQFNPKYFFPFGKGPKSCIGEALAYLEAEIVIKAFCSRFTLKSSGKTIEARPFITLHPENEVLYVS